MLPIKRLSDETSVTGWLTPFDFADVKKLGFDRVVNFRPDNEARGQITSADAQAAAERAGLAYVHIPVTRHDLFTDEVIAGATKEFGAGRTLGYCASGLRAAIVWAAAAARTKPVADVLSSLHAAGFDLEQIRDNLEAQADRARWSAQPGTPATDSAKDGPKTIGAAA